MRLTGPRATRKAATLMLDAAMVPVGVLHPGAPVNTSVDSFAGTAHMARIQRVQLAGSVG